MVEMENTVIKKRESVLLYMPPLLEYNPLLFTDTIIYTYNIHIVYSTLGKLQ